MHIKRAPQHSVINASWVVRICGRVWGGNGPGISLSTVTGPATRRILGRSDGCTVLERELDAAIAGLHAACLDAALSVVPRDGFAVELRSASEAFIEMFETRDLWSDPARAGAYPGFAALRDVFEQMTDLIGDIQAMGGRLTITRIRQSNRMAEDRRIAAAADRALDRYLARRAVHVVRPLFADRSTDPRNARFFDIGVKAGLRAAPTADLAGRVYYRRGLEAGAARRLAQGSGSMGLHLLPGAIR